MNIADFNELKDTEKRHFYKCKQCGEMVEKSLRLAFFISVQCLREAHKLIKSALQLVSHSIIVPKTVARDKPHSARPVAPYQNVAFLPKICCAALSLRIIFV